MQENTKQVIVKMTARRCFRTEPIFQYDVGHVLSFEGFELPAAFEVHFSLSPMGKSITQIGQNGVCVLPDMYAQTAAPIYAWLYIADTETGLTKYSIEIPVQRRAKPTDQQPTPVQQSAIDQAIAALNAGVEAAEDAQEAAEAAQASAESYAESAGQSAITATNAATSAASSAGNAAASATSAGTSATDANASRQAADLSATNAGVSERNAAASATAAAGSATSAAASASQASGSATAASGSASTASAKASEAAQSATAAVGSAASASEDAGTASTAATAAEASATAAAGSATAAAGSATSAGQSATAAAGSAAAAQEVLESIPEDYSDLSDDVDSLKSAINDKADVIVNSASGNIASFDDGADGMPVKELNISIEPVQDLHGQDAPYPPGGGKNKLPNAIPKTETISGITYKLDEYGVFTISGTASGTSECWFPVGFSFAIPSGDPSPKIAFCNSVSNSSISFFFYNGSTLIEQWALNQQNRVAEYNAMQGKTCDRYMIRIGSATPVDLTFSPMIVENSVTDYTFKPYSNICPISGWTGCNISHSGADTSDPTVYPIAFPSSAGIVYGDSLTINEDGIGTLVVERAYVEPAFAGWTKSGTSNWWANFSDKIRGAKTAFCSHFKADTYSSSDRIQINNTGCTTLEELRAYQQAQTEAGTPVQIVYKLKTASTYTLTASQVTTLFGSNRIWADTGSLSVDYCADTKLYIEQLTKPTEDGMTANTAITNGKFFMIGNRLFLATATIASGATITPGTNCTELSLADALNNINA